MEKSVVIVLIGPTAVGKTETALALAKNLDLEIVSADSMQVYRGMNIGTAKPSANEQKLVKHHLIDILNPDEKFTVARYVHLAGTNISQITAKNKVPLITGGTGLYINALIDGFLFPEQGANETIRKQLQKQAKANPLSLYEELQKVDQKSAARLHPNDLRRIIRALEVYRTQKIPISTLQARAKKRESKYIPIMLGLTLRRDLLYQRIEERVDQMIANGLVEEVKWLLAEYPQQPTALQAIGYKEISHYINGFMSLPEAVALLKRETRRYAKRQLSWFRRDKRIAWFDVTSNSVEEIIEYTKAQLKKTTE